jgi:hypothetical protein
VASRGAPRTTAPSSPSACRQPSAALVEAGLDAVQVANNHALDFGRAAFDESLGHLEALGIAPIGLSDKVWRTRVNGVEVGVIGFSGPYLPSFASHHDIARAGDAVAALAHEVDVVIVLFYGGGEGVGVGERSEGGEVRTRVQYRRHIIRLARHLVDRGADLVAGFGAHHVRAMEWHKGRLIAYCLGNGVTWGPFNLSPPNPLALVLEVTFDGRGAIASARAHPFRMRYPGVPRPDPASGVFAHLRRVSEEDLPASATHVDADGFLRPRVAPDPAADLTTEGAR